MNVAPIATERLDLVWMTPEFLRALLGERREEADRVLGAVVPEDWPDDHDRRFLEFRLRQTDRDPEHAEWLVRALVLRQPGRPMIGHAGFHGKPGVNGLKKDGAVEVGYTVFEPYRGRGYATETVRGLLRWASEERGIRRFVASVAPTNEPSLAIIRKLGFRHTGRQWDEEDGEELVFELAMERERS